MTKQKVSKTAPANSLQLFAKVTAASEPVEGHFTVTFSFDGQVKKSSTKS